MEFQPPTLSGDADDVGRFKVFPRECRERHITYSGKLFCHIGYSINGVSGQPIRKLLGEVPIMVKVIVILQVFLFS